MTKVVFEFYVLWDTACWCNYVIITGTRALPYFTGKIVHLIASSMQPHVIYGHF